MIEEERNPFIELLKYIILALSIGFIVTPIAEYYIKYYKRELGIPEGLTLLFFYISAIFIIYMIGKCLEK